MKRIISIAVILVMVLSVIVSSAVATDAVTYITDGDWTYAINSDTSYLIAGYNGTDNAITMPATYSGKPVIGVAEDFYDRCDVSLTSIEMPDSYTVIQDFAFYEMSSLTSVHIPSGLTAIGTMAFSKCSSISNVDLSAASQLKSIPYSCFSNCESLSSVSFPESITTISDYAFSNSGLQSVVLPTGVTGIGSYSFKDCGSLESVTLPNGLEKIGGSAFYNNSSLTSVYVPLSVSSIGSYAFYPMALEGSSLTIDCYDGSYAASYAHDNYLNYTTTALVKGDIDNNGVVNIRDVTYIQLYRVGKYTINTDPKTIDRVDVTDDYEVTIRDATQIQLYLAHLVDTL